MDLAEALGLLQLKGDGAPLLGPESLRRQYLKLALRTHPDKNPGDAGAAERFSRLGAAYTLVLQTMHADAAVVKEQQRTSTLLQVLLRALQGEAVEGELQALGEYRPPAEFGVDLSVSFDARVPPMPHEQREPPAWRSGYQAGSGSDGSGSGSGSGEGHLDLRQAFKEAFEEEGLTEEGDPIGGFELKQGDEIFC